MKRFLIHVDTNWCGEEDTFRAVAESEIELWDIAEQLAYDNFYSYGHDQDIAEEEGYDPLRILRGIRFSITKRLRVSEDMWQAMKAYDYFDKMPVVSEERIREELTKCFKCNSSLTLGWLSELTDLRDYIFKNTNLWLKPTSEK